jgi:predicted dehydrogenase
VDCIVGNRPHIATGEEGLIVMQLLDAIYESAARGRPVEIKRSACRLAGSKRK